MAPKKVSSNANACKYCKKVFDETPNPLVKDPLQHDKLSRRCVGSKDCKACYAFIKWDSEYGAMTPAALEKHLTDADNQSKYDGKLAAYCESRRAGKRPKNNMSGWVVKQSNFSI